jgi:predicted phosphate transport protein (TIGR00153 family)
MGKKKHYSYFKGYSECTNCAVWAAKALDKAVSAFSQETAKSAMNEVHGIEHESDTVKHRMLENLAAEFLPPIERQDISALINELDNVVDGVDEVMMMLRMYRVEKVRKDMPEFTKMLIRCCEGLGELVNEFENFKKSKSIKEKIIKVNSLESEGDTVYFNAVSELFATCKDPVEIMVWKEIYSRFEECFDDCEHAADMIEDIILSNS